MYGMFDYITNRLKMHTACNFILAGLLFVASSHIRNQEYTIEKLKDEVKELKKKKGE